MSIWTEINRLDFTHTHADVKGVRTRVLRAGSGPDVICLHGTSGHLEAFANNVAPLVEAGFTVHALDMLGHGYTDKPDFDFVPPAHAEHLSDYIREHTRGRVHILGESLGGWVGAWLAAEMPDVVDRLVLIAPGGTAATPEVMERIRRSTSAAVLEPSLQRTRERLELLMFDPAVVSDELVNVRHAIYTQPAFKEALPHILCLQELETRKRYLLDVERLGRIAAPTLLIWGRQNPFGKLDEAEFIGASVPGCQTEIYDDCGHWPQFEKSERFNRDVITFLTATATV